MTGTYSSNLGIELPADNTQDGTWGQTVNLNSQIADQAISGIATVLLASAGSSGSPYYLDITEGALSEGRNPALNITDGSDLGATAYVQLTPNNASKIAYVRNSLSGSRSLVVFQGNYNASNAFTLPAGRDAVLFFSGTGTGSTVTNAFQNLRTEALTVEGDVAVGGSLSVTGNVTAANLNVGDWDTALQPGDNISTLTNDAGYITNGLQPGDNISTLTNDAGYITNGLQAGDNVSVLTNDAGYLTSEIDTLDSVIDRDPITSKPFQSGPHVIASNSPYLDIKSDSSTVFSDISFYANDIQFASITATNSLTESFEFVLSNSVKVSFNNTYNGSDFKTILVGKSVLSDYEDEGVQIGSNGVVIATAQNNAPLQANRKGGNGSVLGFYINSVISGGVTTTSGGTPSFLSGSDIRLKNNVVDHPSELQNLMSVQIREWVWKSSGEKGEGVVAQELETTAWSDLVVDSDDSDMKQVIGFGPVETRLAKCIQEQQVLIEMMESRISFLESVIDNAG